MAPADAKSVASASTFLSIPGSFPEGTIELEMREVAIYNTNHALGLVAIVFNLKPLLYGAVTQLRPDEILEVMLPECQMYVLRQGGSASGIQIV